MLRAAREIRVRRPVLGIETATAHGSAALWDEGGLLGELTLRNPQTHSEMLLPSVRTLLHTLDRHPRDLSAIAVSIGPGSFTGLRVGAASAKGLAFALGIPLYGIPTLEVLAENSAPVEGSVCALLDARRGEVFYALFARRREGLFALRREGLASPDALAESLEDGTVIIGRLSSRYHGLCGAVRKGRLRAAAAHLSHPRAAVVAARGLGLLRDGLPSQVETLVPRYLRPSDAESGHAKKRGGP